MYREIKFYVIPDIIIIIIIIFIIIIPRSSFLKSKFKMGERCFSCCFNVRHSRHSFFREFKSCYAILTYIAFLAKISISVTPWFVLQYLNYESVFFSSWRLRYSECFRVAGKRFCKEHGYKKNFSSEQCVVDPIKR